MQVVRSAFVAAILGVGGLMLASPAAPQEASPAGRQSTIVLRDRQPFAKGRWLAWLEPWGAGSLVQGKDYTNAMTIAPDLFPAEVVLSWSWPNTPTAAGVYNFLALNFGNSHNTVVPDPVPPRRIRDLAVLRHQHDFSLWGDRGNYNAIVDFWLTREAGRHDTQLFEVEIFLHASDLGKVYARTSSRIGIYKDEADRTWHVSIDRKRKVSDILFLPSAPIDSGTLDIRAMLLWLKAQGTITGEEWFNGLGTGVEVTRGDGAMKINSLSVTYE